MTNVKRSEFDYTMMSTFLTCRRKYKFRMIDNIRKDKPLTAPEFGKCIHGALDLWYVDHDVDKSVEWFKENYKEDLEKDNKRTHRMGEWILRNYHEKYRDQALEVLGIEVPFDLPLPNGNRLIGRIDKIVKWDGAIWGIDHKTTSGLGYNYFKMHTPNMQFDGYTWAIQQLGYPKCRGIMIDAILVAKGLLESSSRARLTPLARDFAYRASDQLEAYITMVDRIQRDIRLCEDNDEWYPNYDSCTYWGECEYRTICMEHPSIWKRVIDMDYIEDKWDPRGEKNETTI